MRKENLAILLAITILLLIAIFLVHMQKGVSQILRSVSGSEGPKQGQLLSGVQLPVEPVVILT